MPGVLLPVFAAALPRLSAAKGGSSARWRRYAGLLLLSGAYVLISNHVRLVNRLAETPWNFLQSYVLFGGILLLWALYLERGREYHESSEAAAAAEA